MIETRKISPNGRAYYLQLPKRWCDRVGLTARSPLLIRGEIDGKLYTYEARVVAHGRGVYVAVPHPWRRWWRLTFGSHVVLLLGDGPQLSVQPLEGTSPKEWKRRGMAECTKRLEEAARGVDAARAAGYAEGFAVGYGRGLSDGLRMARDVPREDPPRPR